MNIATLLTALPIVGILAGLARAKFPRAPFIAAGFIIAAFALYVVSTGVWAATCWDCDALSGTQGETFVFSSLLLGLLAFTTLLGIWLGARFSLMLSRLLNTVRELREAARPPTRGKPGAR